MKELTSSYDDLEKRMAIYSGIGALLFSSLYLFIKGADLWTYLIRGIFALTLATLIAWLYFRWVRDLFRRHSSDEELPENTERQSRDAKAVEGKVIQQSELPEAVIPAESEPVVQGFELPELDAPMIPSRDTAKTASANAQTAGALPDLDDGGDLPPPPVPSGI